VSKAKIFKGKNEAKLEFPEGLRLKPKNVCGGGMDIFWDNTLLLTVFSRLNDGGGYLKLGHVDPTFIRTWCLFGAWHLFIKCIFSHPFFIISAGGLLN